jgi:hypothetical protein
VTIGPFTSIGDNARLQHCVVSESVLLPGMTIEHWPVALQNSLMGHHVQLFGEAGVQAQGHQSLSLADDSVLKWQPSA